MTGEATNLTAIAVFVVFIAMSLAVTWWASGSRSTTAVPCSGIDAARTRRPWSPVHTSADVSSWPLWDPQRPSNNTEFYRLTT